VSVDIQWVDSSAYEQAECSILEHLGSVDGLIVPGGFGSRGVEGKINAIQHAREHGLPFLGICYGMQLAVVEYARNICGLRYAHTTEVYEQTPDPVVTLLPIQQQLLHEQKYGGTMRLGAYSALVKRGSLVHALYVDRMQD